MNRTQTLRSAPGVLLRQSGLSLGVASRRRGSGAGFSVSVVALLGTSEILRRCARPQSSHLSRCGCVSHLSFGSTHPPRQLPRQVYANGLDVGLIAMVIANSIIHRCFTDRGNFLVISSTVAYTIGLTWGGITSPWGSATVLIPLVLGFVGLGVFVGYEATLATRPLVHISTYLDPNCISRRSHQVPFSLITNSTSISG